MATGQLGEKLVPELQKSCTVSRSCSIEPATNGLRSMGISAPKILLKNLLVDVAFLVKNTFEKLFLSF